MHSKWAYFIFLSISIYACFLHLCWPKGAFTPDANDANKSRYSREVGRLNILSLLAPFAWEIRAIRAWNSLHNRRELASWEGLLLASSVCTVCSLWHLSVFAIVWGRCPAERGEQTLRCAQLSARLCRALLSWFEALLYHTEMHWVNTLSMAPE